MTGFFQCGRMLMWYFWIKALHVLFVMGWVAAVFYLPRILVNLAEVKAGGEPTAVSVRLELMGRRLYRFGHIMFGLAAICGLLLWQGWRMTASLPPVVGQAHWIHAKLGLVVVLFVYYILTGRRLKKHASKGLPSALQLRLANELPVLLVLGVLYLVMARPF